MPKSKPARAVRQVLSRVGFFCYAQHLLPSDTKFLVIRGRLRPLTKNPDNEQYALVQPIVGIFAERCICSLLTRNLSHRIIALSFLLFPLELLDIGIGGLPRWLTHRVYNIRYNHKYYCAYNQHCVPYRVATHGNLRGWDEAQHECQ